MNEQYEIKTRILVRAKEMFEQFGYSRVTMEEIAAELGISKKTLYKFFSNKEHLMKEIIQFTKCQISDEIDTLLSDSALAFIEKIHKLFAYVGKLSGKFQGPMIEDLMKNHPALWQEIKEFRHRGMYDRIYKLITEGVEKGFFRRDINHHIITLMYVGAIHSIINPEVLFRLQQSAAAVFNDIIKILFQGILAPEWKERYVLPETQFQQELPL